MNGDQEHVAEIAELVGEMNAEERRVFVLLGRLYLERQVAPGPSIDAEIASIERGIRNGDGLPTVPPTQ